MATPSCRARSNFQALALRFSDEMLAAASLQIYAW
jgi:hypothetical protein